MENWKGNKYVERLIKEWLTHGKIVLACDFDDTIFPWGFKSEEDLKAMAKVVDVVQLAQNIGIYLAIWSACAPDRFDEVRDFCNKMNMKVDSINENPIPLPYGNHRKMYYNHLLDDRAGLEQAVDMLEYACYRVLSDRKQPTENFDI
jgi:hypothetical protein